MAQINKVKLPNGTTYDIVPSASDITIKSKLYFEAVSEDNVTYKKLVAEYVPPDPEDIDTTGTLTVYDLSGNAMFTMDMNGNRFNLLNVLHTLSAGTLSANNLTANRILVSDANKNIVSSDLSTSDLVTGTVTIGRGGTGATTRLGAAKNLTNEKVGTSTEYVVGLTTDWGKFGFCSLDDLRTAMHLISSKKNNPYNINNAIDNGFYYVNSGVDSFGQSDGACFTQAYNDTWVAQIYIDYRTGQMLTRGKNNGSWQIGRIQIDSGNYSSYALPLSGGTLKGTLNISGNYSYRLNNRVSIYDLGTTVFALCANGGATVRRYDNANKYAGISANAFTNVSSRLIKKNIKNISDDEAKKILDLRIVDFDYEEIVGGEKGQIGLIAEETIDIFPHCVKVPDNYNEETTKQQLAEGKVLDLLELDYSKLVAPLIKMVQIQQRQIEELKAEVEKLKDVIES